MTQKKRMSGGRERDVLHRESKRITVLCYIASLDRKGGGTSTYMQLLSKYLGKLVNMHIVTHPSPQPVAIENAQIHYIPVSVIHFFRIKQLWIKLLRDIQPDIVHVNGCWIPWCACTQKWAQESGYKVVLTPHGMLEPWIIQRHYWTRKVPALLLYQQEALKKADYIHCTSEMEKNNLLKLGYNHKLIIIPNGIEIENIPLKSQWEKTRKVLYLSRIHPKKGIELLIDAVAQQRDRLSGYTFIIAGEGNPNYIRSLQNKIESADLSPFFDCVGGVYGAQKQDLFHSADLFILPTHSENFGIVIAEALASGTPVITTKGTPWEEVRTCQCGWWIDNTVDAVAKTLQEAIDLSAEEYKQMGLRGVELIKNKYTMDIVAKKMEEFYYICLSI